MKLVVLSVAIGVCLLSASMLPSKSFIASGLVSDIVADSQNIYAATMAGSVDVFNRKNFKKTKSIFFPKITNFLGESIQPKVFSVDVLDGNILAVVEDKDGFRSLYLNNKKIIGDNARLFIKKGKFIDKSKVLLGMLSNEMMLMEIATRKIFYTTQINTSTFSDYALSEDKTKAYIADESGIISVLDIKTGKKIGKFEGQNVDNVYQIDYKNGVILGCGQDRRASIYTVDKKVAYHIKGDFLIYSGALSPLAKIGAFAHNTKNELKVFDVGTKKEIVILQGSKANISRTIFLSENEIVASSEDKQINLWRIK